MKTLIVLIALIAVALSQGPPFLEGASDAVLGAWAKLTAGFPNMSDDQIEQATNDFVANHPEIKEKFDAFQAEVKAAKAKEEEEHAKYIATLSPEAQAADKELMAVANDHTITLKAKGEKIEQIFKSLPPEVAKELSQQPPSSS
ncbi:hypothetical protein AB6A40_006145 [Gnathostoma spinigerum]|uniref:SXP/RAL-2 family protein Ani s 5-like cation-binding domain-containing protein n=1 Tax=Gnathostoma spinigerum TaxID=75299 RepID=A0ABD6EPS9_9BILA